MKKKSILIVVLYCIYELFDLTFFLKLLFFELLVLEFDIR